jgi:hypothetical protein
MVLAAVRCLKDAGITIEMALGVLSEGEPKAKATATSRR